jgi:hypothetical protein
MVYFDLFIGIRGPSKTTLIFIARNVLHNNPSKVTFWVTRPIFHKNALAE